MAGRPVVSGLETPDGSISFLAVGLALLVALLVTLQDLVGPLVHAFGFGCVSSIGDGTIVLSNAAPDRILGVPATDRPPEEWAEHYGVFLSDGETAFPTDEYPLVRALRNEPTDDVEMLVRNPNRPEGALISIAGRPLRSAESEVVGAVVVFRDVTRLSSATPPRRSSEW